MAESKSEEKKKLDSLAHWRANLKCVVILLSLWFFVSFGCGILFREWLDANLPSVGNAPFGFWMAQQGSIICFVLLLIVYNFLMNGIDRKFGYQKADKEGAGS